MPDTAQKLPIGLQDLAEVIAGSYVYIDKTEIIAHLLNSGKYFFLSPPRRFGKLLTLSTIRAIYEGKRELFANLSVQMIAEKF